ncbi:tryptophan halogenase family protein [Asticcacaulis sp. AC460]|uniref:tryptophan halogenase family protein n=1 Tax=Asticcacaulis sp. AC460 TaxID=1282360 RepID=UPI0004CEF476|nr:tryptophan halogenase family protein [Asticcacaulis sp. AC460]
METPASQGPGRSVLIVGGGAAGWLTASYLASHLGQERHGGPRITLLESPDIGIIGVGEGTFPTTRNILRTLGIEEAEFMRESQAAFKQGIRFDDWEVAPKNDVHSHYFHPFEAPYIGKDELDLLPYWLIQDPATRPPYAEAVTFQKRIADARLAPKRLFQGHYSGPLNYAYHFDAARFAGVLARRSKALGVHHLQGLLGEVVLDDTGAISHAISPDHGRLEADLYIDCTGFRSELLGKALNVPFRPVSDMLFADRAVVCQVPYPNPNAPLESYTIATAHEAGWTWDIGLANRRGIGYVHSSHHSSEARAEGVLAAYVARSGGKEEVEMRHIKFDAGYRTQHWVKNCVAVGLSAGFLEPLESTGMVLIEAAVNKIAEFFPHSGRIDASAGLFNDLMVKRYEAIITFIKLHYCLSKRDEPFWRDNAAPDSIPERLRMLLDIWQHRPPSRYDFVIDHETFAHFNYQYILYGMNFQTDYRLAGQALPMKDKAEQIFARIHSFGEQAAKDLSAHRATIKAIYDNGFVERAPSPAPALAR